MQVRIGQRIFGKTSLLRTSTVALDQIDAINLLCKESAMLQHAFQTLVYDVYKSSNHVTIRSPLLGCRMLTGCSCCPGKTR